MKKLQPNKKVGLVTFNNEINIIGDGTSGEMKVKGETLHKYDEILNLSIANGDHLLSKPIG